MQKQFAYLVILALGLAAGIYYIYIEGEETKAASIDNQLIKLIGQTSINLAAISNHQGAVDSIQKIELIGASTNLLNASFDGGQWLSYQQGSNIGIPLQTQRLVSLVRGLTDAVIVETKSANPKNHSQLGLSALSLPGANSVLLRVTTESSSIEILIGDVAKLQNGQYVRFNDNDQMLLIDRKLNLPIDSTAWLQKSLFNLSVDDVVSVKQQAAGEKGWRISNEKKQSSENSNQLRFEGENFTLDDLKPSEQIAYPNIIGNYVSSLMNIKFDRLMTFDALANQNYESVAKLTLRTFTDQLFVVELIKNEGRITHSDQAKQTLNYAVKIESPNNNDYLNEWIFGISSEQAQNILKNRNDFLKKPKSNSN